MQPSLAQSLRRPVLALVLVLLLMQWALSLSRGVQAQEAGPSGDEVVAPADEGAANANRQAEQPPANDERKLSLLNLYFQGGIFMYPITLLSVIGVIAAIERGIALRRSKVVPDELIRGLGQLSTAPGGFDPRKAFRLCQQYPSAAATIVRTLLLRIGRPVSEVETAVSQASDREATRLYQNVRWLNLAATTGTLLGLLGTIQGMIMAFHRMTGLPPNADKATELSAGIYTALVTTFAGLCVAIPSVMAAHYFEGRIQALFMEIEELIQSLLPQIERFEGRVRFGKAGAEDATADEPLADASASSS